MTNLEALEALQELFSDPARWTTNVLARDAQGHATNYLIDKDTINPPVCWCLMGGIAKATNSLAVYDNPLRASIERAAYLCFNLSPETVNDTLGLDAVRQVIAHAIEVARANPQELSL